MNNIMPLDKNLNPVPVLPIGTAQDITDGTLPSGASRIIRITAVTDCRLWQYRGDKTGNGVLLPSGQTEYFSVYEGYSIEISGTVNYNPLLPPAELFRSGTRNRETINCCSYRYMGLRNRSAHRLRRIPYLCDR